MAVFKFLIKIIAYGFISISLIVAAILAYEKYYRMERDKLNEQITIEYSVLESENYCDMKIYPYLFTITNNSNKVVNLVEFNVEVRRNGYSKKINRRLNLEVDKILNPNERYSNCFYAEADDYSTRKIYDKNVNFTTSYKYITFDSN